MLLRSNALRTRRALVVLAIIALCSAWFAVAAHRSSAALNGKVLIVEATLDQAKTYNEITAATELGFGVDVVDDSEWAALTTADFAQYNAIVFADDACGDGPSGSDDTVAFAAPLANLATWTPAVTGNVMVHTFDPTYHGNPESQDLAAARAWTKQGIAFATANSGATGMYLSGSCWNGTAWTDVLDGISPGWGATSDEGDDVHIVGSALPLDQSDADLSGWGSSFHHTFTTWPSDFTVYAIGTSVGGGSASAQGGASAQVTVTGPYTAPDGTEGVPVAIVRGTNTSPSHILLTPATQTHDVGTAAGLDATVKLQDGTPAGAGITVTFTATAGPAAGTVITATTNAAGIASINYPGLAAGTDTWEASFVDTLEVTETSNSVVVIWTNATVAAAVEVTPRFTG